MDGASGVLALVLAETAAGGAAVMWLTGLWGRVKRGFFVLTTSVVLACALLASLAASSGYDPAAGEGGRLGVILSAATAGLMGLSLAALILRQLTAGRVLGLLAVPTATGVLLAFASLAEPSYWAAALQLMAGALFMGAVTVGLLLGHWYLVDRGLARDHIQRLGILLIAAVAIEAVAVVAGGVRGDISPASGFSPLLTVGENTIWLAVVLGMVGATALISVFIHLTLRESRPRSVQAATGFFYLAVITAFTAELAAKVRFLG